MQIVGLEFDSVGLGGTQGFIFLIKFSGCDAAACLGTSHGEPLLFIYFFFNEFSGSLQVLLLLLLFWSEIFILPLF